MRRPELAGAIAILFCLGGIVAPAAGQAGGGALAGRILTIPRPRRIVSVDAATGARRVLFHAGDGWLTGPSATPDGRRVAFILRRSAQPVAGAPHVFVVRDEIWTMNGDGSDARAIRTLSRQRKGCCEASTAGYTSIDISPDGSRLLVVRGSQGLYTLRADGSHYRRHGAVTVDGYTGSDVTGAQFTPGGQRILGVFDTARRSGIGTIPLNGGAVRFLPNSSRVRLAPTFSEDGRWIAYVQQEPSPRAHPRQSGRDTIWLMRANGSGAHRVLAGHGFEFENPDFSPDGRSLVFGADPLHGSRIVGKEPIFACIESLASRRFRCLSRGVLRFANEDPVWVR